MRQPPPQISSVRVAVMPIPYSKSLRSATEALAISLQVVLLDWLSLGHPDRTPAVLRHGKHLTTKHWSAVAAMKHLSWDVNSPEFIDVDTMGCDATELESFEDARVALSRYACWI